MNEELLKIYEREMNCIETELKSYNASVTMDKRATNPFLISVNGNYSEFKNSIMIFGQETNSWCKECGISGGYSNSLLKSLTIYDSFYLKGGINNYRGPFWNEFKRIKQEVNKTKNAVFVWNNINKIGRIGKGNIKEINEIQFRKFHVIREELKILKPQILVFFTGNDYDHFIRHNIEPFEQIKLSESLTELKFVNEFKHLRAFKTFHPNALYRQGKNKIVILNLISEIKKACV